MKYRRLMALLIILVLLGAVVGMVFGSAELSLGELLDAFSGGGRDAHRVILWKVRFPRVLAGILAGAGLAVSGALLQTVTANELAGPNIIGINSGAGLAVILLLSGWPEMSRLLPLGAFVGALAAALIILVIANSFGSSGTGIVLMGVALTSLMNAMISFLSLLDEGVLAQYNHFTVGSLKGVPLGDLLLPGMIILASFAVAMAISSPLGVLCMGDSAASALGVPVRKLRLTALVCAAACSAAVVSFAGLLGFVGLVVPHIAKRLAGMHPSRMLPVAALTGAFLVTVADLLGRTLFAPSELPVGILLSVIGSPYFLYLLCRRRWNA